jgi:thiopeptide-type bacteriocin biosynthesis protein
VSSKPHSPIDTEFQPSGFFVFRTPLLPYEELEAWSSGLRARAAWDEVLPPPPAHEALALDPARTSAREAAAASSPELEAALAADRECLRSRLRQLTERPEILEALFVASPSLFDGLEIWRAQPEGKKGQRAERALVRYFYRMAARATPFGLFSGCSTAAIDPAPGSPTRLTLAPRPSYRRHTRLDMDYLFALCEDLERDPGLRRELRYRPNSSLYRAAGRLRYAEARLDKKVRSHHLVAVEVSSYLEDTLRRARGGALASDLAAALVTADPDGEITAEEAEAFITELIDSQVLVSDLSPPVTGPEAIHDLVSHLGTLPAGHEAGHRLAQARDRLAEIDAAGPGVPPRRYQEIAEGLAALPTTVELARLFQVDMVKPADAPVLGAAVLAEITRGLAILHRLGGRARQESLERFRKDFAERYGEGRQVPLVEALDEEIGIGFERSSEVGAEASPLLQGLVLSPQAADPTVPWGSRQGVLLGKLAEALARGERQIELSDQDLERMAPASPAPPVQLGGPGGPTPRGGPRAPGGDQQPLPDSFQVMAVVAAPSQQALDDGDFRVLLGGAAGPSGARLLGRFCHADAALVPWVERHLRAEEELRPEAVFAEIVHLPQGRIGNILSRPVLRGFEIPYLGRSGAPEERQIPITDLLVGIEGARIVLRSARLGREVVPRLTSAHNFAMRSLGVYRFLCSLQAQGTMGGAAWNWGPLDGAPFLPRVTAGRVVLSRASWWLSELEIKELAKTAGTARFAAVQSWREKRGLPRVVLLADGDNELLVDLDNVLSIDTFLDVIEGRDRARLAEFFPGAEELPACGPEGRFVHELVIPFERLRGQAAEPAGQRPARRARDGGPVQRSFPPGSEWLYAKLYTGTSTADRVLREVVTPLVRSAVGEGAADGWFFIRYGDPEWHLRVRFHGPPEALRSRVLAALYEAAAPLLEDGRLWRLQLDTYEREMERYGGAAGIELAERLFQIDSETTLAVLDMLEGDEGADVRWRLALCGTDALLADLGLDAAARLDLMGRLRLGFGQEFSGGPGSANAKGLQVQLDQKFRGERRSLDPLLDPAAAESSPLAPALSLLRQRSQALAPVVAELRRREQAGELIPGVGEIAASFVHMHLNRMIRSAARAHELVLYEFLYQIYRSRAARSRGGKEDGEQPARQPSAQPGEQPVKGEP